MQRLKRFTGTRLLAVRIRSTMAMNVHRIDIKWHNNKIQEFHSIIKWQPQQQQQHQRQHRIIRCHMNKHMKHMKKFTIRRQQHLVWIHSQLFVSSNDEQLQIRKNDDERKASILHLLIYVIAYQMSRQTQNYQKWEKPKFSRIDEFLIENNFFVD